MEDIVRFYQPYAVNQIVINKMFVCDEQGSKHLGVREVDAPYQHGMCKNYGAYSVYPNGSVLGCCGEVFFYPKIKDKIPNIFQQSLQACKEQSDALYLGDPTFIEYCKHCAFYWINNQETLQRRFIDSGYFAMQYATQTRYFVIPEYLRGIPEDVLLFMYEKDMVRAIKDFKERHHG